MSSESQGLQFFSGANLLPDAFFDDSNSYLSVVGHLQGTSPSWLVNSLVENTLRGTAAVVNSDLVTATANRHNVLLVSFNNNSDYYTNGMKKNGLNLARESNYQFIDYFTDLFSKHIKKPSDALNEYNSIFTNIEKSIKSHDTVVVIEGLDILLSATSLSADNLLGLLYKLNKRCLQLFVIFPHDIPQQVNMVATNPNDPAGKSADFLIKLHHRSSMNLFVQPLPTGRASDLSGSLTVSKGPVPYSSVKIIEREYTFNVSKDSSVKLYYR